MVEGQLDTHMPKNTFRPLPHTIHRYQLKVNLDLNAAAAAAAKSLQSCPTLCNPIDDSPPGSSVHGILQARVLEWGAIAFSSSDCSAPKLGMLLVLNVHCCLVFFVKYTQGRKA